ncbi:polyketide synthase [Apiospora arundinis]
MMMRAHLDWLAKNPDLLSLADLSYTLCHRRSWLNWRFGCVAQDRVSLMQKLQRGLENGEAVGGGNPSSGFRPRAADPYVIFVFTGQGAQWAGMGRELFATPTSPTTTTSPCPIFQKSIAASSAMLKELGAEWDLAEELQRDAPETRLNTAALAQPATTALQIALVDRLRAQGIKPRAVVGHSSGEIAAAYAAGRLSHRAAVGIAYHRGCCVAAASSSGSGLLPRGVMMAVGLGEQGVAPYLKNLACGGRAGVACVNSPDNVTLSGDSDAVDEVAARLAADERGVFHRRLMVDTAYHSHHMQVVAEDYLGRLDRLPVDESCSDTAQEDDAIAFISSVSGRLKTDCFNSAYWTANLVSQVRFCDAIQTLVNYRVSESSGRDALFIEIGPHNALSGPVRQTITEPDAPRLNFNYYSVLQRKVDAVSSTLSLASSLFERGVKFDMNHVTSLTRGLKTANVYTNLPAYPWDHSDKHWYESRVSRQYRTRPDPYHDLLGVRVADSTSIEPRWRHMVCLNTLPWLAHHVVDGLVVFPGSGYLCMATEAIRQIFRERHSSSPQQRLETIVLRNVSFHRALVVPSPPRRVEMQLSLDPQSTKSLEFSFRITAWTDGHWYEHCSGLVEAHLADGLESVATTRFSQTDPEKLHQSSDDERTVLDPEELYAELADVGNTYGPSFTGIKSFSMTSDSAQAKSTIQVPDIAALMPAAHQAPHLIHPSTLDILLHTALPLVGRRLGRGSVMPTHIEELVLAATDAMPQDPGSVLTAFTTLKSSRLRTSHADLAVTSGDIHLLNMYGIEMRSLGSTPTDSIGSLDAEGICYELDWKPDPLFLSAASVETSHTKFEDVLHFICFKNAAISVLELGSGNEDLSLTFIDAAAARGGSIDAYSANPDDHDDDTCFLVVDDQAPPILSDPGCFDAVAALLNQPARIVWVSPDDPMSMHQITGVARTAHAENYKLRLTTIHAPAERLASQQLQDLVVECMQVFMDPREDHEAYREREYWLHGDGTVLIPRLYPSRDLNRAVNNTASGVHDSSSPLEQRIFTDPGCPLVLSTDAGMTKADLFVQDHTLSSPLAVDEVEIEMETFALSKQTLTGGLCEYGGVISQVGTAVKTFAPGDRVMAVSSALAASRIRVSQAAVGRVSHDVPPTYAAMLFSLMAASHALRKLADLPPTATVLLLLDALSPQGQAAISVARFMGIRAIVTAIGSSQADELVKHLGIPRDDIWTSEALPHLRMDRSTLCTRDVSRTADAIRMVESGAKPQVVVTARSDSKVNALVLRKDDDKDGMCGNGGGWDRDDVSYVVAGGLGDLGRRLLLLMAHRGAKHLVTLSRSLPSRRDKDDLQASLEAAQPGCRLYCVACDLTSESSVQEAAETLQHDRGVPPVDGTLLLERAFGSPSLDFFLMLSSAANIVGTGGQANYNAGNAVQDALAQARRRRAGNYRYISLNIGWIEDAVHTTDNDARTSSLGRTGLRTIQSDELSRFFDYALGASSLSGARRPQLTQAIIGFDSVSLSHATSHSSNVNSPMFCHVRPADSRAAVPGVSSEVTTKTGPTATEFKQVLESGDNEAAVDYITVAICGQLAKLISVDVSRVNAGQSSMLELGLDSLVAIELRNWLMRTFDAPLQSSEIMDDQTIRALGAKVVSRSRLCNEKPLTNGVNGHNEPRPEPVSTTNSTSSQVDEGVESSVTSAADETPCLPPLPTPSLHEALRMFEDSRRAIDSTKEQAITSKHVQSLTEGIGPSLQKMVENGDAIPSGSMVADGYERQIYLKRREPLQDYSEFTVGHPLDAPVHSQARRAAIVTIAAAEFARRLAAGQIPADTLHGMPMSGEARDWLFWSTRRPGAEVDRMERHVSPRPHSVVVLRRGHVFELELPEQHIHLQVSGLEAAFEDILGLSEEPVHSLCSLTADNRKSWFLARSELETDTKNAKILQAIDTAMFVVCLDDESPMTSGKRHTQFLLGGQEHPFTNRWLDKPTQFAVTANGLSAGIFEHTKIDGLDVRTLHQHIVRALFADDHHHANCHPADLQMANGNSVDSSAIISPTPAPYRHLVRQHSWSPTPAVLQRVEEIQAECQKSYGYIDHRYFTAKQLSPGRLRASRTSPHATAHLASLLAVYLVDKDIRPAWEIVTLGTWAGGRIDWVQTVSPAVRSFLEMAAAPVAARTDTNGTNIGDKSVHHVLRQRFHAAARGYSQAMAAAARGHGYVRHLYALLDAFTRSQQSVRGYNDNNSNTNNDDDCNISCKQNDVPSLFRSHAWNSTRRGGPSQGLKIGFMPDGEDTDDHPGAWDEGGFLMDGDDGVYLHCGIRGHGITFAVSAHPKYADAVCAALDRASSLISSLLEDDISNAP